MSDSFKHEDRIEKRDFSNPSNPSVSATAGLLGLPLQVKGHTTTKLLALTLLMLRLLLSKAQERKHICKPFKPYHVGIHWIALAEYSHMSTHLLVFQSFFRFLHNFDLAKLATSSLRVKYSFSCMRK